VIEVVTDPRGRFLWTVAWGRPGRHDWQAVLAWAFDADEALATVREAHPDRPPPQYAVQASAHTVREVVAGTSTALG
ncbi:MAG TPA: hypothetical protein VHF47_05050, partial [Acidimicrobiales bacterium]|nr:hypothetical protein [Acidimicrobiales bacterium]